MLGGNQYYFLVSGLKEYSPDVTGSHAGIGGAVKDFDAWAVYKEIRGELSREDRRSAGLLMSLADISRLGRERIEWLYARCASSESAFLREWGRFDRNLRNVIAAHTARGKNWPVSDALVGADDIVLSLTRSTAADFNLKGELEYIDRLLSTLENETNIVEKERVIDLIRWNKADELSETDSFGIATILAYLVKINIIGRWMALDPVTGRQMYDRLVAGIKGGKF